MPGQAQGTAVVGRDTALDDVARFVEAAAVAPAALLLEGEPGIGKTTLWRSALAVAADRRHRVLATTVVEGEADLPFVALRDLLDDVAPDAVPALPPPQRAALDAALLRSDDPHAVADPHAVCVAALGVVRALTADRPLVIAVDDVGWLDRSSERVLRFVVRRLTTERVGVLATRREADAAIVPLGLDGPPLHERLSRITLGRLDADVIHTLLTDHYRMALPRRLTRRIHAACGGNPFSAVQIGRALLARGDRILDEDDVPMPGDVLRVTTERIAALRPAARHVLAVAAVTVAPTPALLLEAGGEEAADGLDEAVAEGLLQVEATAVRFTHPLLRSAAAVGLGVGERRQLHARLAELTADPDERAVHLAAAAVGPDEHVAEAVAQAARRAFLRGAPDTAAVLAARAVALTPADRTAALARRRLLVGQYRYRAEDMEAARAALNELLAALPVGDLRAEALLWLACVRKAQNGLTEAAELARAALAQARGDVLRTAAGRLLAQALVLVGAVRSADRHATDALACARATGDPASIAEGEATLAWTRFWVGRGLHGDLLAASRAHPWSEYAPAEVTPDIVAGVLLNWADHLDEARAVLHAEDRRLVELGHERPQALVRYTLADLECRAGNWAAARHHAEVGLRAAELVDDEFHCTVLIYARGLVAALCGDLDDARADGERAEALAVSIGSAAALGWARSLLGFCALSAGDHATVDRHLGPITAQLPPGGAFDPGFARFVADEVEALVALGRTEEAQWLLDPFADRAAALDRPGALGAAGRCRALLLGAAGDLEAAQEAADVALAAHDRVGLPFERARTLLVAGSVHRRLRRRRESRAALDEALAEFTRLGATAWAVKARAERDRIGGRTAAAPHELTDAEQRIAEQVAAGLSNKEVAAALFLSVSTVEAALWKVYRKLDVRSRTQLAARLADRRN